MNLYFSEKLLPLLAVFFLVPFFSGCYLTTQSSEFLRLQRKAEKIETLLDSDIIDAETVSFLESVTNIKIFAYEKLGLAKGKNFTTYVELDKKYVALILQAASQLEMKHYLWKYPIVGSLPYRGFFNDEDAKKERDKMKEKGYDTTLWGASAFSTLGFFKDPLYSYHKEYNDFYLASLIIHEETHATFFLKKHTDFNEQFASFVGDEGAYQYISEKWGNTKAETAFNQLEEQRTDDALFSKQMIQLATMLDTLYKGNDTEKDKLEKKIAIIKEFKEEFSQNYGSLYNSEKYRNFGEIDSDKINNAYLSRFLLYDKNSDIFKKLYKPYKGNLKQFVIDVKQAVKKAPDPWKALESF